MVVDGLPTYLTITNLRPYGRDSTVYQADVEIRPDLKGLATIFLSPDAWMLYLTPNGGDSGDSSDSGDSGLVVEMLSIGADLHRVTERSTNRTQVRTLDRDGHAAGWAETRFTSRTPVVISVYQTPDRYQSETIRDDVIVPGYNHVQQLTIPGLDLVAVMDRMGRLVYLSESVDKQGRIIARRDSQGWQIEGPPPDRPKQAVLWFDIPSTLSTNPVLFETKPMPRIWTLLHP